MDNICPKCGQVLQPDGLKSHNCVTHDFGPASTFEGHDFGLYNRHEPWVGRWEGYFLPRFRAYQGGFAPYSNFPALYNLPSDSVVRDISAMAVWVDWIQHEIEHIGDELNKFIDDFNSFVQSLPAIIREEVANEFLSLSNGNEPGDTTAHGGLKNAPITLSSYKTETIAATFLDKQAIDAQMYVASQHNLDLQTATAYRLAGPTGSTTWRTVKACIYGIEGHMGLYDVTHTFPADVTRVWIDTVVNRANDPFYFLSGGSKDNRILYTGLANSTDTPQTMTLPHTISFIMNIAGSGNGIDSSYIWYLSGNKVYKYDTEAGSDELVVELPDNIMQAIDPVNDVFLLRNEIITRSGSQFHAFTLRGTFDIFMQQHYNAFEDAGTWSLSSIEQGQTYLSAVSITPDAHWQDNVEEQRYTDLMPPVSAMIGPISNDDGYTGEYAISYEFNRITTRNQPLMVLPHQRQAHKLTGSTGRAIRASSVLGSITTDTKLYNLRRVGYYTISKTDLMKLSDVPLLFVDSKLNTQYNNFLIEVEPVSQGDTIIQNLSAMSKGGTVRIATRAISTDDGVTVSKWTGFDTDSEEREENIESNLLYYVLPNDKASYTPATFALFTDTPVKLYKDLNGNALSTTNPLFMSTTTAADVVVYRWEVQGDDDYLVQYTEYRGRYGFARFARVLNLDTTDEFGATKKALSASHWVLDISDFTDDAPDGWKDVPVNNVVQQYVTNEINEVKNYVDQQISEVGKPLYKLIQNLINSGAWSSTDPKDPDGDLNPGRDLATGNINLFGGAEDGTSFIRTNSGSTENDLAGGV